MVSVMRKLEVLFIRTDDELLTLATLMRRLAAFDMQRNSFDQEAERCDTIFKYGPRPFNIPPDG